MRGSFRGKQHAAEGDSAEEPSDGDGVAPSDTVAQPSKSKVSEESGEIRDHKDAPGRCRMRSPCRSRR